MENLINLWCVSNLSKRILPRKLNKVSWYFVVNKPVDEYKGKNTIYLFILLLISFKTDEKDIQGSKDRIAIIVL